MTPLHALIRKSFAELSQNSLRSTFASGASLRIIPIFDIDFATYGEEMGYAAQSKHLGEPVLWATTEVGDVNSYVHIWAYKDLAERTVKRAAMWADPEWLAYVKKSAELGALIHQECKILIGKRFG